MQYNTFVRQDGGKFMVAGSYPYSFIQRLHNCVDDCIREYGELDAADGYSLYLSDLDHYDQGEIAALYLETINREVTECVWGNDFTTNSNYVCSLLKMLSNPTHENKSSFATLVHENVLIYFNDSLQALINDRCDVVYREWLTNKDYDE